MTASRYASTTHCICEKEALNAVTSVGRPTLAILLPIEEISILKASAHSGPEVERGRDEVMA
ncbi:hypothetical protein D3C87_2081440 [compost metagenome]